MTRTYERFMESRLAKMRTGKGSGEIVILDNHDEETEPLRFVVVPLTDGEYIKSLSMADEMQASDSPAGIAARDEKLKQAILLFASREIHDWTIPFFESIDEVDKLFDHEINAAYDIYLEMVSVSSPAIQMLGEEEIENLKKVWQWIEWSELSGQQWFAAKRFLNSIQPILLRANYSGLRSTSELTTMTPTPTLAESVLAEGNTPS